MNVLNNSSDEVVECPLCMEPLEADDLNFYPCTCGYQICRFCWHRIRTDENELCPACRKAYPENPADFTPLSQEQIAALKAEKRQRDQQRKQKITENRKHLANVRVVQKNLVFVVGLPPRLADADILKRHEYFGKYGKIHKVVINPSTAYAGQQGPSASAYVTYVHNNDALRAIQSVNNIVIDGRLIKTSLGTTKYCSHFMKNQQCPKGDCMYLHELGDPEASFTKDEMHQGKHQEYEKRLHDALIASSNGSVTTNSKSGDNKLGNGTGGVPNKEAWPSLSISPVNTKEQQTSGKSNGKGNKENGNRKHDKTRGDKKGQKNQKSRNDSSNNNSNSNSSSNHNGKLENNNSNSSSSSTNGIANGVATTTSNGHHHQNGTTKDSTSTSQTNDTRTRATTPASSTISTDKPTTKQLQHQQQQHSNQSQQHPPVNHLSADDEVNLIDDLDKDTSSEDNDVKNGDTRSLSSSSSNSSNSGDSGSSLSESTSGKSSPGSFPDHPLAATPESQKTTSSSSSSTSSMTDTQGNLSSDSSSTQQQISINPADTNSSLTTNSIKGDLSTLTTTATQSSDVTNIIDTSACLSKLSLFDDSNSFFTPPFEQLFKDKLDNDNRTSINNQLNNAINSHLPDLLNGIDGYPNQNTSSSILNGLTGIGGGLGSLGGINTTSATTLNTPSNNSFFENPDKYLLSSLNTTEEWEQALKYLMMRNTNKHMEDQQHHQQQQQQQHHQQQQQQHQQEEYLRLQELQKRNLINSMGMPQNYMHDFNVDFLHNGSDMNRLSQSHLYQQHQQHQQQQQRQPNGMHQDHGGSMFGTNMSKFFDFHKNQQQQQMQHQHFLMNGYGNNMMNDHRDHLTMATLLENNRLNSQHMDHTNGFDPFFETQKALAELMENEQSQNNHNKHLLESCQRTRMPPPGFNHMNAFGFGVPRPQSNSSKILPFMNSTQQMPPQQNNWSHHMGGFPQPPQQQQQQPPQQQQQQQTNDPQMHMGQPNQNHNKGGYGNMTDWTAMDPAILSFRQFPSYSSHQPHEMFMQHLNQQSGQGFGHHGQQMQNNLMNQQQQNSQAPVNYSHSNWFNNTNEQQNMFMNSLGNGYTSNYEKFSMPPGIHINNMSNCISGKNKQKTECIN